MTIDPVKYNTFRINCFWTISILIGLVIVLSSSSLTTRADLKDILSFAVSFASLILAIFAIGQTAFSTSATSETITKFSDTSASLQESALRVQDTLSRLPSVIDQIDAAIGKPADVISKALEDIVALSRNIEGSARHIEETSIAFVASKPLTEAENHNSSSSMEDTNLKFEQVSAAAVMALFVCFRSFDTGYRFSYKILYPENEDYQYFTRGFIDCLRSFNLLQMKRNEERISIGDVAKIEFIRGDVFKFVSESTSKTVKSTVERINDAIEKHESE